MRRLTGIGGVSVFLCGLGALLACEPTTYPGEVASPSEGMAVAPPPQTAAAAVPSTPNPEDAGSCAPEFVSKGNALVAAYLDKSRAAGVSVAFYDNGKTCFFAGGSSGGPGTPRATPDTIFTMGSVQKVFTTTLLASEIVQGHASIDDPAVRYLVAADGSTVARGAPFSSVTLRHLVTHSAALPQDITGSREPVGASFWRDRPMPPVMVAFLDGWSPEYPIGTRYKYANLGFVLAGYAATRLARKPVSALLSEIITGPLGMTHTAETLCDVPNPMCAQAEDANGAPARHAPVGLRTTARDLGRFVEAQLGAFPLPDLQTRAIALTHNELFRMEPNHAIGMGWEIWHGGDELLLSKNGEDSGFTCWVAFQPTRHRGIALLSNGPGPPPPAVLGKQLLDLAAGGG